MRTWMTYRSTARHLLRLAVPALVAGALTPVPAPAQSGADLLEQALERYEAQTEGIDSYTVTQEVMGMDSQQRYVKQQRNGHTIFVPEGQENAAAEMNPWAIFPQLTERAELAGTEMVNGVQTHVITVSDVEGLDLGGNVSQSAEVSEFRPRSLTLYLGTEDYLIHRMKMDATAETAMGTQDVNFQANLEDYRQVEGFYHPFRMTMHVQGLSHGMSEQEAQEARQQLEQLREQMESMPEEQRAQMEKMLEPQLEQLRGMLDSGDMEFTVTVKELKVNTPPAEEGSGSGG